MLTTNKISLFLLFIIALIGVFTACNSSHTETDFSDDAIAIHKGDSMFIQYCSGCHNFKQDGIGPQLSGITKAQTQNKLLAFIKNPNGIIQSGDVHAQQLYSHYKTLMPSFSALSDDNINAILAYINTFENKSVIKDDTSNAIADPIPSKIQFSGAVIKLGKIIQIPASSDSGKKPLARITKLSEQSQTGKLFVVDLRGKLYTIQNGRATVYMDMQKLRPHFINQPGLATGFGSFAFHPDFLTNGLFYTTHAEAAGSAKADFALPDSIKPALQWVLTEWKADDPKAGVFKGIGRELLRIDFVSGIHGVQEISFNPRAQKGDEDYGLLYIGVGDGGAVENGYPSIPHKKQHVWGTILRIDPIGNNSSNGKYGIPPSNPFVKNNDSTLKEIYAYGFRNPHRFSWTHTGQMIACNIGQSKIESVDYTFPGHDYGWPIREGYFMLHPEGDLGKVYPLPADDSSYHITYPIAMFDHDEGKAICGGFEYTGNAIPALKNKFLFGDIYSGRLFYIIMADIITQKPATVYEWKVSIDGQQQSLQKICGSDRVDLHFAKDYEGNIYILTKADGKIYKLVN